MIHLRDGEEVSKERSEPIKGISMRLHGTIISVAEEDVKQGNERTTPATILVTTSTGGIIGFGSCKGMCILLSG